MAGIFFSTFENVASDLMSVVKFAVKHPNLPSDKDKVAASELISTVKSIAETSTTRAMKEGSDGFPEEEIMHSQTQDARLKGQLRNLSRDLEKRNVVNFVKEFEELTIKHLEVPVEEEEIEKLVKQAINYAEDVVDTHLVSINKNSMLYRNAFQVYPLLAIMMNEFDRWIMIPRVRKKVQIINEFIRMSNSFMGKINERQKNDSLSIKKRSKTAAREPLKEDIDEAVVGLNDDTETLVELILKGSPELQVVSITGMAGTGKTTVARKIYYDSHIKENFHCRAWVYVSHEYKLEDLLREILSCQKPTTEEDSEIHEDDNQLKELTAKYLKNKRFLLVLDDVCSTRLWDEMSYVLPNDSNGSRLLITTRNNNLALYASGGTLPHSMPLPGNELELFNRFDFLAMHYKKLPWRLKPCLLYMAAFPKGVGIPVRQLIQLWMAEGFVQYAEDGEHYLQELIDENLIQASSRRTDGGVKTCRIHDQLWQFCLSESENDMFLKVPSNIDIYCITKPRRLYLCCSPFEFFSIKPPHTSSIRSLHFFPSDIHPFKRKYWSWLQNHFKLIRVLNLGKLIIKAIPDSIGQLIILKYLKIESEELKVIPASIGNILYLQTLDLRLTSVNGLPFELWKLKELRHVYVPGTVLLPYPHLLENHSYPRNLQGFSMAALDENAEKFFREGMFRNIRKLGLRYKPNSKCNPSEVLAFVSNLNHLQTLKIFGTSDLPRSSISFPRNLTKITLGEIEYLPSTTILTLEDLPEIRILKLLGCRNPEALKKFAFNCNANGFPQLQVLQISSLHIQEFNLWEGAMPRLQNLVVRDCTYLTVLPYHLWGLIYMKQVEVLRPSRELAENLRKVQVKDKTKLLVDPPLESASSSKY